MAFGTLKADTLTHSTAGSLDTNYVVNGSAKAWMNLDGESTAALRSSFNLTSITDNGTGDYTATLTSSMSNSSYATPCSGGSDTSGRYNVIAEADGKTTGAADFFGFQTSTGSALDQAEVSTSFLGDLA